MRNNKWLFSVLLIFVGLGILLYPNVSNYFMEKNQVEVIKGYKEYVSSIDNNEINLEYEKAKIYNENICENFYSFESDNIESIDYENILNLSNNGIMSYIEIPKINSILPIYHGTEDEIMKKGVGHIKKTSLPIGGKNTHCVLTGHTGLLRAEIFTRLSELEVNDYFYINTLGEKLVYKIYQVKVVLPTEVQDLQIMQGKDLVTLVTCTPYGVNTHRLLVQGERVEEVEGLEDNFENDMNFEESAFNMNYNFILLLLGVVIFVIVLLISLERQPKNQ